MSPHEFILGAESFSPAPRGIPERSRLLAASLPSGRSAHRWGNPARTRRSREGQNNRYAAGPMPVCRCLIFAGASSRWDLPRSTCCSRTNGPRRRTPGSSCPWDTPADATSSSRREFNDPANPCAAATGGTGNGAAAGRAGARAQSHRDVRQSCRGDRCSTRRHCQLRGQASPRSRRWPKNTASPSAWNCSTARWIILDIKVTTPPSAWRQ